MNAGLQPIYTLENLAPEDIHALCNHFNLPTPTPDTPLAIIVANCGTTPQAMYNALQQTCSIRLMIAAAAIRGITRLPPDPQLAPKPLPPLRHAGPRPTPTAQHKVPAQAPTGLSQSWRLLGAVVVHVAPYPGTKGATLPLKYARYRLGATADGLVRAGLNISDLSRDCAAGNVTFAVKDPSQ